MAQKNIKVRQSIEESLEDIVITSMYFEYTNPKGLLLNLFIKSYYVSCGMTEIQNIQMFDEEDIKKRGRPPLPKKMTKKDRRRPRRKICKRGGKTINDSYGNCENRDDYIFAMRVVKRHEDKGIYYLKYLGYKNSDIRKNNGGDGKADLSTINDDKDWEVKIVGSSKSVGFTYEQIKNMRKDTNVLIFDAYGYPEVLKFDDILSGKYKNKYNFVVYILLSLSAAINMTKYIEEEKERDVV